MNRLTVRSLVIAVGGRGMTKWLALALVAVAIAWIPFGAGISSADDDHEDHGIVSVPEPTTLLLLGIGLTGVSGGVFLSRRRRS
jgi:hypothetical protein